MLRLLFFSDLHLERISSERFVKFLSALAKIRADCAVLAGDIGSPHIQSERLEILSRFCNRQFQNTIMVMGNHEHYGGELTQTKNLLSRLNFTVLDQNVVTIGSVKMAGATLWSKITSDRLNDFHQINYQGRKFSVPDYQELHQADVDFLNKLPSQVKLIITHHAPLLDQGCSAEKYKFRSSNCYFETDLSWLVAKHKIWIHGHTHHRADFNFRGCRLS